MIETYPNVGAAAEAAAHAVAGMLVEGLRVRGRASLVATGGRTPAPLYDRLGVIPMDWSRVVVTLSDERCVAPDRPEANIRLVRERLLRGPAARARLLPLWPEPEPEALEAIRPFDAVVLGMGEDGHVASLIPGDPGLEDALATADALRQVPEGLGSPPTARVTLTLSALLDARIILVQIGGAAKRLVAERAAAGDRGLPIGRLIAQSRAPVRILWSPEHGA